MNSSRIRTNDNKCSKEVLRLSKAKRLSFNVNPINRQTNFRCPRLVPIQNVYEQARETKYR